MTDSDGCSAQFVTAGQTAYCNGSGIARKAAVPFQVELLGKRSQKAGKAVKLKVRCPVACSVKAVGRVKLSGGGRAKAAKLKAAKAKLRAGKAKTLKLKLSRKGRADVAAARKAVARLKVSATDGVGDSFKAKRGIKLR